MKELLRETVLGNLFWTVFQALAPMIWFYPLNELEISGYEAFALLLFSPLLLGIPILGRLLRHHSVLALLRLVSLASLVSFQASTTLQRLVSLSVGCFCLMLVFTASLFSNNTKQRCLTLWGLVLGLFAFISSRVWFTTFVPAWWNTTSNTVVIAVTAIATLDKIMSGDDTPTVAVESSSRPSGRGFLMAVGFGSLVYLTQAVFGELSLVSRWVDSGYPDTGPQPYPWGVCVLIALWFGATLSPCSHVTNSALWWVVGTAGFATLYFLPTWQAFAGGLVLAVYVMSVWPVMADRVSTCPPVRTVTIAVLVWLVEMLFSVWTVAYNFVPGGVYTREKTSWLIAFVMISIGLAIILTNHLHPTSFSAFVQLDKRGKMPDLKAASIIFLLVLTGLGGYASRYHQQTFSHPAKSQPRAVFTAAIWTYHFGYDNVGWPSLERSALLLNGTGADFITLLESDASKPFLGNNDLGMWLGEKLRMYVDFGPSTRDHTWGNLILSKYPIVKSTHHLLPSPHGELAPAITATINMSGNLVDFVVTHMGNDRDVIDREQQAKFLANELDKAENPVVFLGYVTSEPFSRDYRQLTQSGRVKDIDSSDTDRWCEYIMYRGLVRLGYARISHGGLSDTEVQVARFRIPDNPTNFTDNDRTVTDHKGIEDDVRFDPQFGGYSVGHNWNSAHEHRYHMSTPKYFLPKR